MPGLLGEPLHPEECEQKGEVFDSIDLTLPGLLGDPLHPDECEQNTEVKDSFEFRENMDFKLSGVVNFEVTESSRYYFLTGRRRSEPVFFLAVNTCTSSL